MGLRGHGPYGKASAWKAAAFIALIAVAVILGVSRCIYG